MNATSRSSAPRSPAIATIPDAPPATIPSEAVGRSSRPMRARTRPAAMVTASVATLTSVTGSQRSPRSRSVDDWMKVPSATPVTA